MLVGRKREVLAALQRDLVVELDRFGIELAGECREPLRLGKLVERAGNGLRERHAQKEAREIGERRVERKAARLHLSGDRHRARGVVARDALEQPHEVALVDGAKHLAHCGRRDATAAVRDRLVE